MSTLDEIKFEHLIDHVQGLIQDLEFWGSDFDLDEDEGCSKQLNELYRLVDDLSSSTDRVKMYADKLARKSK